MDNSGTRRFGVVLLGYVNNNHFCVLCPRRGERGTVLVKGCESTKIINTVLSAGAVIVEFIRSI
jgi:hypothetical protein